MMKLEFEIVDGIWPDTETYIQCTIPGGWLSGKGFTCTEMGDRCCVNLVDLIETHLADGVNEFDIPTRATAQRTVDALRRYADYLEKHFITLNPHDAGVPAELVPILKLDTPGKS